MSARRSALGRGLEALIPSSPAADTAAREPGERSDAAGASSLAAAHEIAVDAIRPNPDQPRRLFDADHLKQLSESISRHGVLQPVVVRRADEGGYELIVGERRWRASRAAGRQTIPAVVADIDPAERLEIAIVENVQRHDLNPIELAHAYRALADTGATQEEIGGRVGLDRSSVANHLRLLELPREIQADVEAGRLSMGHARALLRVAHSERQRQLRDRVLRDALSVRACEELARQYASPARPRAQPVRSNARASEGQPATAPDARLEPVAEALRRRLQTQARIVGDLEKGRIEIDYFGSEDLERIVDMLIGDA